MADIIAIRKEAVDAATKAVELDDKEQFEEAYKYYTKAAEKLNYLSKIDENQYNKDTYRKKAMEYVVRASKLKEYVSEDKKTPVASGSDG
jgi:vacuolar protein-sorting-associated protein 4